MPLAVSVVVPVYNAERFVRESLDSILAQRFSEFEVIVMDDASTDGTPEILSEYEARDHRLRVHRQNLNKGIFANLNDGIALARGELIAFFHADDVYHPDLLSRETDYLRNHREVGAVFCLDRFIDEDGREFGRVELPPDIRATPVLDHPTVLNGILRHQNVFIRGETSLVRRQVYERVGPYDPSFDLRADLDMWLRIASAYPMAVLPDYLVWYRAGHDNSSARYARQRTTPELWFDVVDRHLADGGRQLAEPDALAAYQAHRAADLLRVAANQYVLRRRQDARRTLRRVDPRRVLASKRVRRMRLIVLWAGLSVLVRAPWASPPAKLLARRSGGT